MTSLTNVESLFNLFDQGTVLLQSENRAYLEALIIFGESLFEEELVIETDKETKRNVEELIGRFLDQPFDREARRRAFQLAILKGLKSAALPPGAGITPDTVALLLAHLVQRFVSVNPRQKERETIVDLSVGSANLLTCVLNHLPDHHGEVYGIDLDPLMIRLAYVNANLQQHELHLYRQDALQRVYFPQVSLVLADLPMGLYAEPETAKQYDLYVENEEIFVHHLLIEQALHIAHDGAYLFFVIPNGLFTEPGAERLRHLITAESYIQALLELPPSLFQTGSIRKSIFILQKKGENVVRPQRALLAQLPSLTQREQLTHTWAQIEAWLEEHRKGGGSR